MDMPILYGLVCLVAALLVVMVLKWSGVTESATIVAVLLTPLIIWAVKSDIVQKISAAGFNLEFRTAVEQPVKTELLSDIAVDTQQIEKEGLVDIKTKIAGITPGKPLSLMINIDKTQYYKADIILPYLQALAIYDPDASAVLIDKRKHFIASAPASRVIAFLDPPDELNTNDGALQTRNDNRTRMQQAIESGQESQWLGLPGFTRLSISSDQSNLAALKLMDEAHLKSIIIVDKNQQPIGIAQRDAIVAHVVSETASAKAK